jgi:hypothetical protein
VAAKVPFTLDAPASLAGRTRSAVRLVHLGKRSGALIIYGHDLNGLALLETAAPAAHKSAAPAASSGSDHAGLSLPSLNLRGATGQELDTALGSLVHFTRGGVSFTLVGSVPREVVAEAARAL